MISEADLENLTLARAMSLLEKREVSAVEITEAVLRRIERLNERMRAFITVTPDRALERPGAPVSVKDLYDTKGIRTTAGSKVFEHRVPREDATLVKRLEEAGAAIVGKTNLHEFAFGVTTINPHYGTARNPWDPDRICGGSSGGSAGAVALFMGLGSLGTDTGGSIRIPAALCGIAGLKPTYGRASLHGVVPLSWSMDHPGPMARTVGDTAILLGIIAGHDPKDPYTEEHDVPRYTGALTGDIHGVRVGIPKTYFFDRLSTEVNSAVANAIRSLEKLGARIEEVNLPSASVNGEVWTQIATPEVYAFHEPLLAGHAGLYGSRVRTRIEAGRHMLSVDYVRAQRTRAIMKEECKAAFDKVDVIVTPATPIAAPRIDKVEDPWGADSEPAVAALTRFTRFFNITGLPAISIPCGFTGEGLPVGLQIAGRAFDETTVLRVAHAYEQDAKWFERRPTI